MIDWGNLAANATWIIGCSVILAALSYASWEAAETKVKFSHALRSPGIRLAYHLGAVLVCAGLAATASAWWEIGLWVLFAIGILAHLRWG